MHVQYRQDNFASCDMVDWYVRDNGHGLTVYVNFMVNCGPWIQCFMAGAALMGGHYRTNIISGVGHPRSDLDVSLVLCMVTYNI